MQLRNSLRYDLPAGIVVFLVALPLCLGIALASDAPLFSGVVTGVIGGIVVGLLSGSHLSVSGPAAGLTVLVASVLHELGSFEAFLCVVVLVGVFQIGFGLVRAGALGGLFPVSVIKGMLVAIGITIILKQIPHAVGGRADFHDEMGVWHLAGQDNVVGEIARSLMTFSPGAVVICLCSLIILWLWDSPWAKQRPLIRLVPGPLVTIVLASLLNQLLHLGFPGLAVTAEDGHLVDLPVIESWADLIHELSFPDFSFLKRQTVWAAALAMAAVASVETLLCIESIDKLDPYRRNSDSNRELIAQGVGNILVGCLGGLPMTSVIVRSSANLYAGARSRMGAVFHGVLLLFCVLLIPHLLSYIPLASLAAVLIVVGYRLAHPGLFNKVFRLGPDQFLPFVVTVAAVLLTDLLTGVLVGLVVGLAVVVKTSYYSAITVVQDGERTLIRFTKDVTFVHKFKLKKTLLAVPEGSKVLIDGSGAMFIDHDIYELIEDFTESARRRGIELEGHHLGNKRFDFLIKGAR